MTLQKLLRLREEVKKIERRIYVKSKEQENESKKTEEEQK